MNANEARTMIARIAIDEIAENENFSKDDATTAVCDRFERYHEEGKFGIRDAAEALGGLGQVLGIVTDTCEEWIGDHTYCDSCEEIFWLDELTAAGDAVFCASCYAEKQEEAKRDS